ncbi:hypothetical protein CEUSTIGMA_g2992.t1 [Chlamydomonas eustigma]|uniref:Fe2OG dioxygenase domain-containing protein n=1 Tax=Chlamydomonas eustigma TaxID=1157962 RepID=A0A250WXY3_9CHLO|nr:hypothetical protein CEUSTIGMA_g2992.t1 [Chlamydomonas eustigma]|eukprot:GAX75549.1 hypothetical protein CEUSTIGMA_g2992.t1 [Chlamydomonas eustigma]
MDEIISLSILLNDYGVKSASEVITDIIDSERLVLSHKDSNVPFLELSFPCKIEDSTIKAKFKSKTGLLQVCAKKVTPGIFEGGQTEEDTAPDSATEDVPSKLPSSSSPSPPLDDADLMCDFADEAYMTSLSLQPQENMKNAAVQQGVAAAQGSTIQKTADKAGPVQQKHTQNAYTSQLYPQQPQLPISSCGSESVRLASSIDGTGLAASLGYSFAPLLTLLADTSSHVNAVPKGNPKKAKKQEKKKAGSSALSVAATCTLKLLGESLMLNGWAVCDNYIPGPIVDQVRKEIKQMESHYTPGQIWVGKEADAGAQIAVQDVRGDSVLWMDDQALTATAFIKEGKKQSCSFLTLHQVVCAVDQLIMHELPRYTQGLSLVAAGGRSDVMLAIYPGKGSRFAKHIDNTAQDGRRLTCLCYLNNGWQPEFGGSLRVTSPGQPSADILPLGGRLACFWSKSVAHEVCPTHHPRHSFTLWFYDALEKAEALAAAKVSIGGTASAAAQSSARSLIRDILAQDVITPTEEGCAILANRVKTMPIAALSIVAGVVGAASVQDFVAAATHMDPTSLAVLRDEIRRMGLQQTHAPSL